MDRRDFLKCSASAAATVLLSSVAVADELFTKIAPGVWTAGSIRNTTYGEEAYQLCKSL